MACERLAVDPSFMGVWKALESSSVILEILLGGVVAFAGTSCASAMVARMNR